MTTATSTAELARQVRTLRRLVAALLLAIGPLVLLGFSTQEPRVARFDELTVGRLNVAGPDGVNRLVLAHEMPQAPFQGRMIDRTVPPGMAGMIFCAPNGDEVGGIGSSADHALITIDYRDTPLEAIGMVQRRGPDGQGAGLVLMDNPTGTIDIDKIIDQDGAEIARLQSMMVQRGWLGVEEHDASLRLRDRSGRDRIVIGVDADGEPRIRFLDEAGEDILLLP